MLDRWVLAAIITAMTLPPEPAAAAGPTPLRFACAVKGAELVSPAMAAAAICARAKAGVDRALATTTRAVAAPPDAKTDRSGWVRIDIRITKVGVASATVTRASGGRIIAHPETSIAQSDRPIDSQVIDKLISEVTKLLR